MALTWSDERYCRLYTRDTPSWLLGPWQARALLPLVLRKLDRAGTLQLGDDGLEALAVMVAMPLDVVEVGAAWWVKRGTFEIVAGVLVVPNFIDAQEAKASDKKRAAEHRERTRDQAMAGTLTTSRTVTVRHEVADDGVRPAREPSVPPPVPSSSPAPTVTNRDEDITHRDAASRTVADRHADSAGVTLSRAVPSRTVPSRAESTPAAPSFGLTPVPGDGPSVKGGKNPKHTPEEIAAKDKIVETFIECFEAKKGVKPTLKRGADDTAAFELAKLGADEGCSVVRRALDDLWVLKNNPTLRYIASKADTWRGTAPQLVNGRAAPPVQGVSRNGASATLNKPVWASGPTAAAGGTK